MMIMMMMIIMTINIIAFSVFELSHSHRDKFQMRISLKPDAVCADVLVHTLWYETVVWSRGMTVFYNMTLHIYEL